MEKEKFESINKTFNYTPNSVFTNQWSSLAFGIGMVVVPLIYPFGLRIRRVHILSPTVLSTILVIGGILLLWFTLQSMRKAKALIAQGGTIKVEGNRVTYPSIEKGKVSLPDKYVIFEIKYFDSYDEFEEFRAILG